ncbi:MAG: peptidoglycan DD-metalloendopeptidase family protein [Pseudomonadota bacterium]
MLKSKRNTSRPTAARTGRVLAFVLVAVMAACSSKRDAPAPAEVRGTDPNIGAKRAGSNTLNNQVVAQPDSNGIVTYDGYQSVIARNGDTVATIADRIGLSASELGAYNGLSAGFALEKGQELVLPPRPGGYGPNGDRAAVTAPASGETVVAAAPTSATTTIEQAPIGADSTVTAKNVPAGTEQSGATDAGGWSPDLAAAAIERSVGLQSDGSLGAPPSATQPVPPEPAKRRDLDSPNLGQYQTDASATGTPTPKPEPGATAAGSPESATVESVVAAADPAPSLQLQRPVSGPVAVGFNKGAGPSRNDGVDFAAAAGSPVVAAADGEVALVSQSLSGLGTIVLVRHPNEFLTVYGRVDGVLVNKGDRVQKGQQIGIVSDAAAPAEPRMHFEVRRGAESLDPMSFFTS